MEQQMVMFLSINEVVLPAMIGLGGIAALFAGILSIASRVFAVHEDPRIEEVLDILPGVNCGACGYPGCRGYAEAIINEGADLDKCGPAGCAFVEAAAKLLGREFSGAERQVAFIHCKGAPTQSLSFQYEGVETCRASAMVGGGPTGCAYGCLGYLDCVNSCIYGAIAVRDDGLPVIDPGKCAACRACVTACPRGLIEMVSEKMKVHILCSNPGRGKAVKEVCSHGCIGCIKCVKECPVQAIAMQEGLAVIDYEKCTNCGKCVKVCPVSVINNYRRQNWLTWAEKPKKSAQKAAASAPS
jgi:Na+-translocating ferredoxin:NAD+ oxidoreductase RNF subunit RnfB